MIASIHQNRSNCINSCLSSCVLINEEINIPVSNYAALETLCMDSLNLNLDYGSWIHLCYSNLISMTKVREENWAFFDVTYCTTRTLNTLSSWVENRYLNSRYCCIVWKESTFINVKIDSWWTLKDYIIVLFDLILDKRCVFIYVLCDKSFETSILDLKLLFRIFEIPIWRANWIRSWNICWSDWVTIRIKNFILFISEVVPFIINCWFIKWIIGLMVNETDFNLNGQLSWWI